MEQLGIMLYGYEKTDAYIIKTAIEGVVNGEVFLISGSRKETHIIENIISDEMYDTFDDKEVKVLMFLGFDDKEISLVLDRFPGSDKITRPIFCGLTENNIKWPLQELIKHLIEERNYLNSKKQEK